MLLFGGEHIKSRRNGKKKYVRFDDVWGYWAARAPTDGTWVRLVDNAGGTKQPVLSPFALVGVRVASAVLVVLLSLGVVALGLFHRFSQQGRGGTSAWIDIQICMSIPGRGWRAARLANASGSAAFREEEC